MVVYSSFLRFMEPSLLLVYVTAISGVLLFALGPWRQGIAMEKHSWTICIFSVILVMLRSES